MSTDKDQEEINPETLKLMKEAFARPVHLTKSEAIDVLGKLPYLGWPKIKTYSGRGPRPRRTQYDEAYDRRKEQYRRLVKAPRMRDSAAKDLINKIEVIAKKMSGKLTAKNVWSKLRGEYPSTNTDVRTVRIHMQKLGYIKPRNRP